MSKENQERRRSEVVKAKTLRELENIQTRRNYAPGWALNIWNARQKKNKQ